jgi:hypothetical protein
MGFSVLVEDQGANIRLMKILIVGHACAPGLGPSPDLLGTGLGICLVHKWVFRGSAVWNFRGF